MPRSIKAMNVLAIDTSTLNLSFAIARKNKTAVTFNRQIRFGSSKLIVYIEKYLKRLSLDVSRIDAFVIGKGPGSFTGLRVGFSLVKAFAIALSRPVVTVGSLYVLAYPFRRAHPRIAVISDAKKNLVYAASFKVRKSVLVQEGKERLIALDSFIKSKKEYFFITPDIALRQLALSIEPCLAVAPEAVYPNAKYLLEIGIEEYNKARFTTIEDLEPLYLHPKTCQIR
jgi:tRNA threonylcarbamoyladenosine biosynthesis protein TsaB